MRCEEGWGEGIAFPFIKSYERECDTLTPTPMLYQCVKLWIDGVVTGVRGREALGAA
jgi:hypothetical protein